MCTLALICVCALVSIWRNVGRLARLETDEYRQWQKARAVTGWAER